MINFQNVIVKVTTEEIKDTSPNRERYPLITFTSQEIVMDWLEFKKDVINRAQRESNEIGYPKFGVSVVIDDLERKLSVTEKNILIDPYGGPLIERETLTTYEV